MGRRCEYGDGHGSIIYGWIYSGYSFLSFFGDVVCISETYAMLRMCPNCLHVQHGFIVVVNISLCMNRGSVSWLGAIDCG